jgi:hypothetical protein
MEKNRRKVIDTLFPSLLNSRWWETSTPLYRKSLTDKIGPWPPGRLFEDWQYEAIGASFNTKYFLCEDDLIETYDHCHGRLRHQQRDDPKEWYKQFAIAHENVYKCAKKTGVNGKNMEMQKFIHSLVNLSYNCSNHGLVENAKELLKIAARESLISGKIGLFKLLFFGFLALKLRRGEVK